MNIVNLILASGKGARLYPLSTEDKPKQFLKLVSSKMMVEETESRYRSLVDHSYTITLEKYEKWIEGKVDNVIYEPYRNESANTVKNGLLNLLEYYPDETIVIQTPSDHYIKQSKDFAEAIKKGIAEAKKEKIAIIGVEPSKVTDQYGYMKQIGNDVAFIEKPEIRKAKYLFEQGYLWNTAIYIYSLDIMITKFMKYYMEDGKSFENTIINKAKNLEVIKGRFEWYDIGTLKAYADIVAKKGIAK